MTCHQNALVLLCSFAESEVLVLDNCVKMAIVKMTIFHILFLINTPPVLQLAVDFFNAKFPPFSDKCTVPLLLHFEMVLNLLFYVDLNRTCSPFTC